MLRKGSGMSETQTVRLLEQSGLFVLDRENGVFYSPKERIRNGMTAKPSRIDIKIALESDNDISHLYRTKHKKHVQHIR